VLLLVHVGVFITMRMGVVMLVSVLVEVHVRVRPAFDRPADAPNEIEHSKGDECPSGEISPKLLKPLESGNGDS
jgi:hypothetical protein